MMRTVNVIKQRKLSARWCARYRKNRWKRWNRWRGHIQCSQSALHSRNTFGSTIILHPRFPLFSGHSIFFRSILFILIPTIRGSIYDGRPRRQRRHRVVLVLAVPFRCVWFCSSYSWLIPCRRPENRYYYTGCAPYVLCVTPINIEETALRPYPERRASLSIRWRMARMYVSLEGLVSRTLPYKHYNLPCAIKIISKLNYIFL